jgi:hypothetical protein
LGGSVFGGAVFGGSVTVGSVTVGSVLAVVDTLVVVFAVLVGLVCLV